MYAGGQAKDGLSYVINKTCRSISIYYTDYGQCIQYLLTNACCTVTYAEPVPNIYVGDVCEGTNIQDNTTERTVWTWNVLLRS